MPILYVPVGIPGCGKSTYGKKLKDCVCLSSDAIRKDLFGDESLQYIDKFALQWLNEHGLDASWDTEEEKEELFHQIGNTAVFTELHDRTVSALKDGKDVYYDATNLSAKNRKKLLREMSGLYDKAIAIYFDVPYSVCLSRNHARDRVVPDDVMESMYQRLKKPTVDEGFDAIETISSIPSCTRNAVKFLIIGRTASGKDTLRQDLEDTYDWKFVTSCTTRPKRSPDEDTHVFLSQEAANAIPKSEKAAWTRINGAEYFATKAQVEENDGYIIDPRGAYMLMRHMPDTKFHIVYLNPIDLEHQKEAALSRVSIADKEKELNVFDKRYRDEDDQFTKFENALKSGELSDQCAGFTVVTNDYKPETIHALAEKLEKIHHNQINCDNIISTEENIYECEK